MEKEIRGRVDSIFIKELRRPAPEAPVLHGTRITHTLLRDTVPTQRCFKTGWDRLCRGESDSHLPPNLSCLGFAPSVSVRSAVGFGNHRDVTKTKRGTFATLAFWWQKTPERRFFFCENSFLDQPLTATRR